MTTTPTLSAPSTQKGHPAVAKISAFRGALNAVFAERDGEINAVLTALVAEEHVLLLGPPGTAKSLLTRAICGAITGAGYFEYLLTKFTLPDELFGPISVAGLDQDVYRRVTTGCLPEAHVAFLDEIFKANSAILNSLLTVLNERQFSNPGPTPIPLQVCIGASNELPASTSLDALYDRFILRRWVDYVADDDKFASILRAGSVPSIAVRISIQELSELRALRAQVDLSAIVDLIVDIRRQLATEHGIQPSDRRYVKCMKLVAAQAVLDGRDYAVAEDLLVLADALWNKPEDRPAVYNVIANNASPDMAAALRFVDAAQEMYDKVNFQEQEAGKFLTSGGSANGELLKIMAEIKKLDQSLPVAEAAEKVRRMHLAIVKELNVRMGF